MAGQRLVLASNNAKKLAELRVLLHDVAVELVAQAELGIAEADEPHITFIENALAKARHAAQGSGLPAIADDSGLCVDALGGAPGVASAHYASAHYAPPVSAAADRETRRAAQDAANNTLLLQRMGGVEDRRAHFVCTLVAVRTAHDPQPLVAVGRWSGRIVLAAASPGGFGYDPLMFIPELDCAVSELDGERKNACSHRGLAMVQMHRLLREVWQL
jgi:XTP/dITP diphosphohydrolase